MEWISDLLEQIGNACFQLIGQPFYYLAILFVILVYRRQMRLDRMMFNMKLKPVFRQALITILFALLMGMGLSLVSIPVGLQLQADAAVWLWVIALLAIFIKAKYACFAYSVGLVGILHALYERWPFQTGVEVMDRFLMSLQQLDMTSLLILVALIHIAEAFWIRKQGRLFTHPLVVKGKRGRWVGGYHVQGFLPIPLFLVVPAPSENGLSVAWMQLLGGEGWSGGWMLLAFPVMAGFSVFTESRLPREKAKRSSRLIIVYSLLLLLLAGAVELWSAMTLVAAILCIVLHEAISWIGSWLDKQQDSPLISDHRGLLVLGTIAGSAAESLGIEAGEIIHKVNGMKVSNSTELHQAFNLNPTYSKLEMINLKGEHTFLQRAIFAGDHHRLGLIVLPEEQPRHVITTKHKSFFSYLK